MFSRYRQDWKPKDYGLDRWMNDVGAGFAEQFDVRAFGAETARADNTPQIQAAIDAAAAHGALAWIPSGHVFKTTGTLETKASNSGLAGYGAIDYRGDAYALTFGRSDYGDGKDTYRNLYLCGVSFLGTSAAQGAVRSYAATRSVIERIKVSGFTNGSGVLYDEYGWINSLRDADIRDCRYAVWIRKTTGSQSGNALLVSGGELGAGCKQGVVIGSLDQTAQSDPVLAMNVVLHGVTIEGVDGGWGVWVVDGLHVTVDSCYFEKNRDLSGATQAGHIRLGNGAVRPAGVQLLNNLFLGSVGVGGHGVLVDGAERVTVRHNSFVHSEPGQGAYGIRVLGGDYLYADANFMGASVDFHYSDPDGAMLVSSVDSKRLLFDGAASFDNVVLKSPDGTRYRVTVGDDGTLATTAL